jgi:hypothetical protein
MAMTADRACLAAKFSDYLFMYYAQPLSQPQKCLAPHVFRDTSGRAGETCNSVLIKAAKLFNPAKLVFDMLF